MRRWLEKQRNLLGFTLAALLRRKGKNLALLTVYTLVVCGLSSVMFYTQAMKREASLILSDTPEIIVQRTVAGRHDLVPLDYMAKVKGIRGVQSVKPRLWGYYYDPTTRANYTLMAPEDAADWCNNISVGEGIMRAGQLSQGKWIYLKDYRGKYHMFKIRGTLSHDSALVSSDLILMSDFGFRNLFGINDRQATDLVVQVRNRKEIPTIASKIRELLPDTRPILREEILRTYDAVFDWRGGVIMVVLLGSVLAFLIFAWDKAAGLSAEEKREIGILKAIGWETTDVLQMKFWEGTVISLSAFLLGILLAYAHIFLSDAALFRPVLQGWSTIYPDFHPTPFLSIYQISIIFFFTIIPYTVATIIPSWRAAVIDPDRIIRS